MKKAIFISLILGVVLLIGCVKDTSNKLYDELVAGLEKDGLAVEKEKVEDTGGGFLKGEEKRLKLGEDEFIYVYLYKNDEAMSKDIEGLSPDGFSYDNGESEIAVEWRYQPHYYEQENMIVIYVGQNQKTLDSLERILGAPFIGVME
nr:hypothetical protein [Tissierella sp.]